jgi:hypothetical protein
MSKKETLSSYTNTILLALLIGLSTWALVNIHLNGVAIGQVQTEIAHLKGNDADIKTNKKEISTVKEDVAVIKDRLVIK